MQPRVLSTCLLALCLITIMFLSCQGLTIFKDYLYEKTEKTTRDITEKLLKNLSNSRPLVENKQPVKTSFCMPGQGSNCILPFQHFIAKYRVAPKYNLNACVIEKSMSTVLVAIMCYLFDPIGFKAANRSMTNDIYHHRFCKDRNEYGTIQGLESKVSKNLSTFTVVRDPIDRFISGYVDKCLVESQKIKSRCYGCGWNVTCFVETQYNRMVDYVTGKRRALSYEDIHFNPQTWYCNFRYRYNSFRVIKYNDETMINEILDHLKKSGVEKKHLEAIKKDISSSKTSHTTKFSEERKNLEKKIRSDPKIMLLLVKMFFYDFAFFGFDLPTLPI